VLVSGNHGDELLSIFDIEQSDPRRIIWPSPRRNEAAAHLWHTWPLLSVDFVSGLAKGRLTGVQHPLFPRRPAAWPAVGRASGTHDAVEIKFYRDLRGALLMKGIQCRLLRFDLRRTGGDQVGPRQPPRVLIPFRHRSTAVSSVPAHTSHSEHEGSQIG
jgi:hypothetical protein